jgi:ABC-type nickel/cobalt efflux system permease component RcnA
MGLSSAVALAITVAIAVRIAAQIDVVIRQVALELEAFEAGRNDVARARSLILRRGLRILSGR